MERPLPDANKSLYNNNSSSEELNQSKTSTTLIIFLSVLFLSCLLIANSASSLTATTITSGFWNNPTTWNCGCVPGAADDVIIAFSHMVTLGSNISVNNLTINASGALDVSTPINYDINIYGNWINNGMFFARSGTVSFEGSNSQTISNASFSETFYLFNMNKPGNDVSLMTDLNVSRLMLSGGDVVLGGFNMNLNAASTIFGGSSSSYVQADMGGTLLKYYMAAQTFNYPVGSVAGYSPFSVTINMAFFGGNDFISVNVTDLVHPAMVYTDRLSRYWTLMADGFTFLNYSVDYTYITPDVEGDENVYEGMYYNTATWSTLDLVDKANNNLTGSAISGLPIMYDFTGGGPGTLPITLTSFTATQEYSDVVISWETASEVNNEFFTIERSEDGIDFEEITTVNGAGNSSFSQEYSFVDNDPIYGVSYYRLKQTDFDGKFKYYPILALDFIKSVVNPQVKVYPNPVACGANLYIAMNEATKDDETLVVLYDQFGKEIFSKVIICESDGVIIAIDQQDKLAPGLYYIVGSSKNEIFNQRLVVR